MRIFQCMATIFKWNFKCKLWNFTQYIYIWKLWIIARLSDNVVPSADTYTELGQNRKKIITHSMYIVSLVFLSKRDGIVYMLFHQNHTKWMLIEKTWDVLWERNVSHITLLVIGNMKHRWMWLKCWYYTHFTWYNTHNFWQTPNVMKYLSHTEIICIIFFRPSNVGCCVNELSPAFS